MRNDLEVLSQNRTETCCFGGRILKFTYHFASQHQRGLLCNQTWRSSIQSAKTSPGVDYGSDHELLIAKLKLTLKKSREKSIGH